MNASELGDTLMTAGELREVGIADSVRVLAQTELEGDPYWPKWSAPWWHFLALVEMGRADAVPEGFARRLLKKCARHYLPFFPRTPRCRRRSARASSFRGGSGSPRRSGLGRFHLDLHRPIGIDGELRISASHCAVKESLGSTADCSATGRRRRRVRWYGTRSSSTGSAARPGSSGAVATGTRRSERHRTDRSSTEEARRTRWWERRSRAGGGTARLADVWPWP
jgi:hypothetical protein